MKVISFALWGSDPRYLNGAIENAKLAKKIYPGWTPIFHLTGGFELRFLDKLSNHADLVLCENDFGDYRNLFHRLKPCFNLEYERVIVRDCDSRLNKREAAAVKVWESSLFPLHVMRDHRHHGIPIMGGMFGVVPCMMPFNYTVALEQWMDTVARNLPVSKPTKLGNHWGSDQEWLKDKIWKKYKDNHLGHDDARRITGKEMKFTVNLPTGQFVGQRWTADNKPESE